MLIGFDASRAYVAEATGTENYSLNLLRALAKVDRKNQYRVYLRDFSSSSLRDHEMVKQSRSKIAALLSLARNDKGWSFPANFEFRPVGPNRLWTQFGLALETWRAPVDLLFVPAHTLPILRRRFLPMSSRGSEGPVAILKDCFTEFTLSLSNVLAMTVRRTKYVVTIHDLGVEYLPGYHQFPQRYYLDFASRYAASHADGIIAVSAATKRDLVKRYHTSPKKIFVVHEGVDRAFFKRQSRVKVESVKRKYKIKVPYILFVGTIQPRKNLLMLIEAFAKVIYRLQSPDYSQNKTVGGRRSTVDLVIAGKLGWDYDEMLKASKRLGLEDRVKFIGRVADCDLPALYSGAAVFAFPSLFEGFGLPILEALACGCPVVASDIGPHREIYNKLKIESGKLKILNSQDNLVPMILAKPNNIGKWVSILYQYISQYKKRSTYTTSGNFALDLFSWEKVAIDTLQVFRKLLS